jgi:Rrf2 family cysteine metabolism transcriptional repressor
MFFTTKAEYGVRLLVALGRHAREAPISLKAVAEFEGLPMGYLEHIAALLRKAGLVESTRGAHGGYRLARDPSKIAMDEVLMALEGMVAPMECFLVDGGEDAAALQRVMCSHELDQGRGCATKLLWTRVHGGVTRALAGTTLAELVAFSERGEPGRSAGAPAAGADGGAGVALLDGGARARSHAAGGGPERAVA